MQLNRRTCLEKLAGCVVGAAVPSLSFAAAPIADIPNDLDIIDCHTHFYDPTRPEGIPWPAEGTPLYRTVLPRDLRALKTFRPLSGTVVVEASPRIEDNAWLLKLAADDPIIVGVVGNLTPGTPEFAAQLFRFAADARFRGIRISSRLLKEPSQELLADLHRLAERDLALDVNGGPDSFAAVAALAPRLPKLRIVQNHIANVRITADPPPAAWLAGMRAAARRPNVFCKVSALVEGAAPRGQTAPSDLEFYRPYLDSIWNAFGKERLIYGSNWPVSERAADYFTLQRLVLGYFASHGADALNRFCATNSQSAYFWIERPGRRAS